MVRHDQIIKATCVLRPDASAVSRNFKEISVLIWVVFVQSYQKLVCLLCFCFLLKVYIKCSWSYYSVSISSFSYSVLVNLLHAYLNACQLFSFHLQLSSSTADILAPVYFEMRLKRYQLPFWSQLPLRGSAD